MSTHRNKRGGPKSTSLPTNSRGHTKDNFRSGLGSSQPYSGKTGAGPRVWGYTPNTQGGQSGITELLSEQSRLNKRLFAQSKLVKLAVTEVRSTEAEHLRMVNQSLIDSSPRVDGLINPFLERNLTDAQRFSEDMVRRQGKRALTTPSVVKAVTKPSSNALRIRRNVTTVGEQPAVVIPPEDWFNLQGPLARYYRRKVERGYKGSPESWIRGPQAVSLAEKLSRKGFTLPPPERWDVFDPFSPLRWSLNKCPVQSEQHVRTGFTGERIRRKATNVVVLRRQAASVTKLKLSEWPSASDGQSWPNYPTLNESWIMMRRAKSPIHHSVSLEDLGFTTTFKRRSRQVLPGMAAALITKNVIGVRADIEVPKKFLGYFRYRWGFLILNRYKRSLPPGLVKHLAKLWKEDISGMFLKYPLRYNDALRRMPSSTNFVLGGFVRASPPKSVNHRSRRRQGKDERLSSNRTQKLDLEDILQDRAPSSDKSDDGVRLC